MTKTYFCGLLLFILACTSCKKNGTPGDTEGTRLANVVADNFNFSIFTSAINYTRITDTLLQPGPFTALVPNDDAFTAAGYTAVSVQAADFTFMRALAAYHILKGVYQLNRLPYAFNQEIKTLMGNSMYVTHWIKNSDSIVTINGVRVIAFNQPASNGLLQVLSSVLSPAIYNTLHDAIAADTALTYFNTALARTGLTSVLEGTDPYTLFAPTNSAFRKLGYPTIDSVVHTNPSVLGNILRYHFFSGRRFIYDYILITDATGRSLQSMSDGNNVTITLFHDNGQPVTGNNSILLQGSGNAGSISLTRRDILAGNGVLHTIDQVLKTNF